MVRILLADDDPRIRSIIREYAQTEDWEFADAADGNEALRMLSDSSFDLVILDVMMPKLDGWQVLKHLRKTSRIPAIMLTARVEEYDRLLGFDLGVDDYVGKPFSPRELIARIKALLKRSGPLQESASGLSFGGLVIDLKAHTVRISGESVSLTPKEYDLLSFLAAHPGAVFTRDQLLNHIWGYDYYGDARTVDTHVRTLRDKLGEYRSHITTVWGTGYRFDAGEIK